MKKILVINTSYKIKGGEDTNIIDEVSFLEKYYEVKYLEFKNEDRLNFSDLLAFFTNSNFKSNQILKKIIQDFRPDIAYVHNTWFKANLGIFKILKKNKINTYLKLHNFRYFCCNHYLIRNHIKNQNICYMCNLQKGNRIFNKYYENSYIKSIFGIFYGKKYYKFITSSEVNLMVMTYFHKKFLLNHGVSDQKINIFRNPINISSSNEYDQESNYIVYAGRLSSDKGVEQLIKAWINSKISDLSLKIVGDGNLFDYLKENYSSSKVEFLGALDNDSTLETIKKSRGVVTATKMYEGQPRLLCEASINGIPSLFPNFGGMKEFFPNGYDFTFDQFNYIDLSKKIKLFKNFSSLQTISNELINFTREQLGEEVLKREFEKITFKI